MTRTKFAIPKLEPAIIVIFGITGDLAKRKLLPALYHLFKDNLLDEHTVILGVSRKKLSPEELISDLELCVNEVDGICDPLAVSKLRSRLSLMQMDISSSDDYRLLLSELNKIEEEHKLCMNRLYYLSVPPLVTESIIKDLGENGLNKSCIHKVAKTRILVEKPFGYDYHSAKDLIESIDQYFKEDQIFRIDHYLAKETVQNILTFRYNNIFENIWDRKHISHILITAAETIGIEGRVNFYEQVGALRDFVQSHLIQLLSIVTLDLPNALNSSDIHSAKLKVLKSINTVPANEISSFAIRGQYKNYPIEINSQQSNTETFVSLCLFSNDKKWRGVPFLLRTGKNLAEKVTEIKIIFRPNKTNEPPNILIFRIQPKEGIELNLRVKKPGFKEKLETAAMDFSYNVRFDDNGHPDAYERVIVDAVKGDHTLFATSEEVLSSWRIIEPIIQQWTKNKFDLVSYEKGSWGPIEAEKLAEKYGSSWKQNIGSLG